MNERWKDFKKKINKVLELAAIGVDKKRLETKKYDIIMLSSIPNFIKDFYNLETFKKYIK